MRRGGLLSLLFTLLMPTSGVSGETEYSLSMPAPWTHLFHVEVLFPPSDSSAGFLDVLLPVWRGGRYRVFDFAGGVVRFEAETEDGTTLMWQKTGKSNWRITVPARTGVRVRYQLYADEFKDRTRGLNSDHGFVDGSAVFMYAERLRKNPVRLRVQPFGGWHVTTALDAAPGERLTYTAPDYDTFVDCPIEIGTQRDVTRLIDGVPHVMSFYGPVGCDTDSLGETLERIVRANWSFWGDVPYRRYVFFFQAFPGAGGGTEHFTSAVLGVPPDPARRPGPCSRLRGLISHEFFHTWNVKRLRPRGMDPYDWTRENYYRELWLAEGGTSYLHGLLLRRAGFSTARQYLDGVASMVTSDRLRPGNREQSPAACSFDQWIQWNVPGDKRWNFETDIYGRGAAISLVLDLEIRKRSGNAASADSLMRLLYRRFPYGGGGYTVEDVRKAATELAGSDMSGFFSDYVTGSLPLPWERVLAYAGLLLEPADTLPVSWLGVQTTDRSGRLLIRTVDERSPAYTSGVSAGDEIVALDGYRVSADDLGRRLERTQPGDTVMLTIFREDRLRTLNVVLGRAPERRYRISMSGSPDSLQREIFESWLQESWPDGK